MRFVAYAALVYAAIVVIAVLVGTAINRMGK